MKPKIIFYGNSEISRIVLEALENSGNYQIVNSISDQPTVGVLASYGKIISPEVLQSIPNGIINIHPSLLPKYRGPTPVQTAILNGESKTGVTLIKLDDQIDHGPILVQEKTNISSQDTSESLLKSLFTLGSQLLLDYLPDFLTGKSTLHDQNHEQSSFTKKLSRDSGFLPAHILSAVTKGQEVTPDITSTLAPELFLSEFNPVTPALTERLIRAFYPWPGVWSELEEGAENLKRLKILKAHLDGGKLVLDLVQLEGKNPVNFKQFLEGHPLISDKYF
jgi:methionyl-tRNA formyltransferase